MSDTALEDFNNMREFIESALNTMRMELALQLKNEKNAMQEQISPFSARLSEIEALLKADQPDHAHEIEELGVKLDEFKIDYSSFKLSSMKTLASLTEIPGLIGKTGKYFDLRAFIESSESLLKKTEEENEKARKTVSLLQKKIDDLTQDNKNLQKKMEKFTVETIKTAFFKFDTDHAERTFLLKNEISEVRLEKLTGVAELKANANKIVAEFEKISVFDAKLQTNFEENMSTLKELNSITESKFKSIEQEFRTIQSKFTEVAEFIKDVRFKRNLNADIKKSEFSAVAKKLGSKVAFAVLSSSPKVTPVEENAVDNDLNLEEGQLTLNKTMSVLLPVKKKSFARKATGISVKTVKVSKKKNSFDSDEKESKITLSPLKSERQVRFDVENEVISLETKNDDISPTRNNENSQNNEIGNEEFKLDQVEEKKEEPKTVENKEKPSSNKLVKHTKTNSLPTELIPLIDNKVDKLNQIKSTRTKENRIELNLPLDGEVHRDLRDDKDSEFKTFPDVVTTGNILKPLKFEKNQGLKTMRVTNQKWGSIEKKGSVGEIEKVRLRFSDFTPKDHPSFLEKFKTKHEKELAKQ